MNVSKNLYCFWTGNNEMSPDRQRCLGTLRKSGLSVVLVTPDNLNNYLLEEHPLHAGYMYLSDVHKADYLRTYFMHFYGGGYSDIKEVRVPWFATYKLMNKNAKYWIAGYPARMFEIPEYLRDKCYDYLIGVCNYIVKPNTPLTREWYTAMLKKMDLIYEDLKKYPARNAYESHHCATGDWKTGQVLPTCALDGYAYPLRWAELLGEIFFPLVYKYNDKVLRTLPAPVFDNYR